MLMQLSSSQLTELEAFWEIEGGFGDFKQEYRFAQLASLIANSNRDPKKRPRPYSVQEFLLVPKDADVTAKNSRIKGLFEFLSKSKAVKKVKEK